jgi:peptide/nickel transport system permease protein
MLRYIGKRLLMMIPIILGISLIVLILIDLTPGDPARQVLGFSATEEQLDEFREVNGLSDPFPVRYFNFLYNAVQGDLGTSYVNHRTVWSELAARFPYTLFLTVASMVASLVVGIPLGIFAATHQYSWKDNAAIFISLFCVSMPSFWFSLILVQFFSVKLGWLPGTGIETWKGWILPAVSLALGYTATIARQTRSDMLEVIRQDFIVTARAKGQTERKVLFRHALKNALIPVITIAGTMFGASLSGALIAEVIFSIPGVGQYTLSALQNRDYPVIQGCVLFLSVIFSVVILLIDVIFAFIDPRIRSQFAKRRSKKIKVTREAN